MATPESKRPRGLRIHDLIGLVVGYGLAALLARSFWPDSKPLRFDAAEQPIALLSANAAIRPQPRIETVPPTARTFIVRGLPLRRRPSPEGSVEWRGVSHFSPAGARTFPNGDAFVPPFWATWTHMSAGDLRPDGYGERRSRKGLREPRRGSAGEQVAACRGSQ